MCVLTKTGFLGSFWLERGALFNFTKIYVLKGYFVADFVHSVQCAESQGFDLHISSGLSIYKRGYCIRKCNTRCPIVDQSLGLRSIR